MSLVNYPSYIDNTSFKFLNIDEKYVISLIIYEYPKYTDFIQVIEAIPKNMNYDLTMYVDKQDTSKVLRDLTYKISSSSAEIKTINKNQIDIDIINNLKNDAIKLRKDIQLNNQDIFNVNIVITFYSNNYKELMYDIKAFQSTLYSKGLLSNLSNFRHLDSYILSLPLNKRNNKLLSLTERTFTTDSLSLNFPFYTKTIFDKKGVIFGFTLIENKICNIDIFDKKYLNSNMCILGSSGSGKSFFTKLLIIKHYLIGKRQYIFDYEGEYITMVRNLNSIYLNFDCSDTYYFNLFQVQEYELKTNNWFERKVTKTLQFISNIAKIENEKDIEVIKEAIIKAYSSYSITEDISSVYEENSCDNIHINNKIKEADLFPTIIDVVNNIKNKKIVNVIKENIINKYTCFTKYSNFEFGKNLMVFNTRNVINNNDMEIIKYLLNEIKEVASNDNKKTIIYIDEIWKYLSVGNDNSMSFIIAEYFKTLRKYNASIIAITQDIGDFFSFEKGNYGKSILNNCGFKLFFRLEYSDKKILESINIIDEDEIKKINRLEKGQALINFCNNRIIINIKASEYEKKMMEVENENSFSVK